MEILCLEIVDKTVFQEKLLIYFKDFKNVFFLNGNGEGTNLLAVSNTNEVIEHEWQFGFIGYDYKNQIENLSSANTDYVEFPDKRFFSPELLFKIDHSSVEIEYLQKYTEQQIRIIVEEINQVELNDTKNSSIKISSRLTKQDYLDKVNALKQHIQLGDIYEINFCQEFYASGMKVSPISLYLKLNRKSPTPFSCFVKHDDKYLLSVSPERFIKKERGKIISQPIKGTIKRGTTEREDVLLKEQLLSDPKEQSENVMIVDLVRNDLSKIANKGSVQVDELFGIYTFPQVHQMISTVSAELDEKVDFDEIINATFPMGSMTGAPKIRAMELIEQFETTKRGIYSGTVGCISPTGDFDFNVIIRSITYNQKNNYLSFIVGGAITANSEPEKEYEECLLKAKAMMEVLRNNDS